MVDSPILSAQNAVGAANGASKSKVQEKSGADQANNFGSVISKIAARNDGNRGNGNGEQQTNLVEAENAGEAGGKVANPLENDTGQPSTTPLRDGLNQLKLGGVRDTGIAAAAEFLDMAAAVKNAGKLANGFSGGGDATARTNENAVSGDQITGEEAAFPDEMAGEDIEDGLGSIIQLLKSERKTTLPGVGEETAAVKRPEEGKSAQAGQQASDTAILAQSLRELSSSSAQAGQHGAQADLDVGNEPEAASTETIVRFSRAGGKGASLEMQLNTGKGEDAANIAEKLATKVEDVTVLESRKFLGLGPQSNANMLAKSIGEQLGLAGSGGPLAPEGQTGAAGQAVHTLKLQMNPDNLGSMTASLRLRGDVLSVDVMVETAEAHRHLSQDHDGLVKALRAQGFAVDHVSIQLAPSQAAGNNANPNGSQGQSFEQGFRNGPGEQMQGGSGGGLRDGGNGPSLDNQGLAHGNESTVEIPAGAAVGTSRPSQVYL